MMIKRLEGKLIMEPIVFYQNGVAFGELGLDPEASEGGGQFYVHHYASGHNACGYDDLEEAFAEMAFIVDYTNQQAEVREYNKRADARRDEWANSALAD